MSYIDKSLISEIKHFLGKYKKIVIIGHKNPDGDCIGSMLALSTFLKKMNFQINIVSPTQIPYNLLWLKEIKQILIYTNNRDKIEKLVDDADIIFLVDMNSLKRIDELGTKVKESKAIKIVLDHHKEPENFTKFIFLNTNKSSAAEVVYDFIKEIDESLIDVNIAKFIFIGLSSDTGNFMYENTNIDSFQAVIELLKFGIKKNEIINKLYNSHSYNRMKLLGEILLNYTKFDKRNKIIYAYLPKTIQKRYKIKPGEHENFVNIILSVKQAKISIFLFENDSEIRISLRSKGNYDVSKVAKKFFEGGGHKNASGGKLKMSIKESIIYLESILPQIIEEATK